MIKFDNVKSVITETFGNDVELLPSVTELFEFELAFLEYNTLSKKEFLERTAYIKSINGQYSKHYLLYSDIAESLTENRSFLTQNYFKNGRFSTGYATHGLFPYRGKFHPQLVKGLINIIGIKPNETILDPMAGSGTTNIEATLMGINSIAIDVSPFCQFMIEVKNSSLSIDKNLLENFSLNPDEYFAFFNQPDALNHINTLESNNKIILKLAYLAYLDALGYSKRVVKSNHHQLFNKVLSRYFDTVKIILKNPFFDQKKLGKLEILNNSDALQINLDNNSIDGIITSPPYSFAIDYVENDFDQLELLGCDIINLKQKMIGLKGKTKNEKLDNYFNDMNKCCSEVSRVLKKGRFFILIIGSNTNQTGGIRLEEKIIDSAQNYNMALVKNIIKPIKGMRNTMKDEHILIFQKE